jgi:hypothetical protein
MHHLRNLFRILLSCLFVVNLYISFDHIISQDSLTNDNKIELLLTQNQHEYYSIDFNQLKQSSSQYETVTSYKKSQKFVYQINNQNSLEQLKFNTQKHTVLSLKPILLRIVINEILIQKSHCI